MTLTVGILIFDDVEELDFVGPWEVFSYAFKGKEDCKVVTISQSGETVTCAKGLRVIPDYNFKTAPALDVILIPGGQGTRREVNNKTLIDWVSRTAEGCNWVTSVCTGALLLHEAGPARGKRVTTHWNFVTPLRERGNITVLDDVRFVRDGNLVSSAGVSAGIDMSLWMLGILFDEDVARAVQKGIEYFPAPPYSASV